MILCTKEKSNKQFLARYMMSPVQILIWAVAPS